MDISVLLAAALLAGLFAFAGGGTFIYVANRGSRNISSFFLDGRTGEARALGQTPAGGAVMPLATSPDRRFLYASIRTEPAGVATFAISSADGGLDLLARTPAPESLTHISVDAGGRFLLGASYAGDLVCVMPIGPAGVVQAVPAALHRPGRNPHAVLVDNSNRFAFSPNLGSDQIAQYLFDEKTGALTPNRPAIVATPRESGPRHLCVSPDNRFVFVLTELSGEILVHALDAASGVLTFKQAVSMFPVGGRPDPGSYAPPLNKPDKPPAGPVVWAADIRMTPDGRFLYASDRTTSTLACLAIDVVSGRLDFVGSVKTEEQPRGFNIDARGGYLAAVGEKSNMMTIYALDRDDGMPRALARHQVGEGPNWVEMATF